MSPHLDEYKATPASKVADGAATFACVPSESIISHHTWPDAVSQPVHEGKQGIMWTVQQAVVKFGAVE